MNRRMILYLICIILRIEAVCMIPGLLISVYQNEAASVLGLGVGILLCAPLQPFLLFFSGW